MKIIIHKRTLYILCLLDIICGILYITVYRFALTSTMSNIMFIIFILGGILLTFLISIFNIIISIKYRNIFHTKTCLIISIIIFFSYFVFILYIVLSFIDAIISFAPIING